MNDGGSVAAGSRSGRLPLHRVLFLIRLRLVLLLCLLLLLLRLARFAFAQSAAGALTPQWRRDAHASKGPIRPARRTGHYFFGHTIGFSFEGIVGFAYAQGSRSRLGLGRLRFLGSGRKG